MDNDTIHTALTMNNMILLDHPACFIDLYRIENVWGGWQRTSIETDVNFKQYMIFAKPSSPLAITILPAFFKRLYRPCQGEYLKWFTMTSMKLTTETYVGHFLLSLGFILGIVVNIWPARIQPNFSVFKSYRPYMTDTLFVLDKAYWICISTTLRCIMICILSTDHDI